MLIVDRLIIGGVRFVLDKVASAVEQELNDDTGLRERLLEAQMRLELDEITQEEFDGLEKEVLLRLREIQARKQGGAAGPIEFSTAGSDDGESELRVTGIEASFEGDEHDEK